MKSAPSQLVNGEPVPHPEEIKFVQKVLANISTNLQQYMVDRPSFGTWQDLNFFLESYLLKKFIKEN